MKTLIVDIQIYEEEKKHIADVEVLKEVVVDKMLRWLNYLVVVKGKKEDPIKIRCQIPTGVVFVDQKVAWVCV